MAVKCDFKRNFPLAEEKKEKEKKEREEKEEGE